MTSAIHKSHADSWHGVIGPDSDFKPENDRYHLYIGLFCPFAHRANLIRNLKGLTGTIPISIVKPYPKGDDKGWPGWQFPSNDTEYPGATPDHIFPEHKYLHEVYFKADKDYSGRYSVPVLWDKETNTIVNNESAEILRNLETAFDSVLPSEYASRNYYPPHLRSQIDSILSWMTPQLNSGVYRAGFALTQSEYEAGVIPVFEALNRLEKIIHDNGGPFVIGKELTEVDLYLYPTLVRFDAVYHQHFKCNLGSVRHDYPVLSNWLKNLYWNVKGFRETTDFRHIKENVSDDLDLLQAGADDVAVH